MDAETSVEMYQFLLYNMKLLDVWKQNLPFFELWAL